MTEENKYNYLHGIDSGLAKERHATIVIQRRVDAVHADNVDGELLKEGHIPLTCRCISQGIDESIGLQERVTSARICNNT